jgi:hypothetical protein
MKKIKKKKKKKKKRIDKEVEEYETKIVRVILKKKNQDQKTYINRLQKHKKK